MVDFCKDIRADYDEVLANAKSGCTRSINQLLAEYQRFIASMVTVYLGKWKSKIDADDVTQFVLFEAFKGLSTCKASTMNDYRRYLMTLCRNKTLNFIEKESAKKRGGHLEIESLPTDVSMCCSDWLESNSLDELIHKLEAMENETHKLVLQAYLECLDSPSTARIPLVESKTGLTRQQTYRAVKSFSSDARELLSRRYDPDLVEAVRDDLRSGQCRRSMRNCYGLSQSQIDEIEVS